MCGGCVVVVVVVVVVETSRPTMIDLNISFFRHDAEGVMEWSECDHTPSSLISRGVYSKTLELYLKYFPKENFLITTQEGFFFLNVTKLEFVPLPKAKEICKKTGMMKDSPGAIRRMVEWLELPMPPNWPKKVNVLCGFNHYSSSCD